MKALSLTGAVAITLTFGTTMAMAQTGPALVQMAGSDIVRAIR